MTTRRPEVWFWYTLLCLVMALFGIITAAYGAMALWAENTGDYVTKEEVAELRAGGTITFALGVVVAIVFAIGPFLPRKRGAWIYAIVLFAIASLTVCWMPITIPALRAWLSDTTRAWFGAAPRGA